MTGIGRYTLEMCRALVKLRDVSLYLYSPAPVFTKYMPGLEIVNIHAGNWDNGLLRQLWSETCLPLWARQDSVDVFWGPAHRIPRWLPNDMARVVTIHDLVWKFAGETMRPLSRFLERHQMPLAVRAADEVVADSQATANVVREEFRTDADRLSVISLGTTPFMHAVSSGVLIQLGIDHPYLLFVGTLEPRKNLARLLTAYSRLSESLKSQASLVIAGGKGWGDVNLTDMVNDLGLVKHVHVLGYVDEQALAALYKDALFLAMPSLYEGFGLPLIEAMAYGTPVLTANNSSMPEVSGDAGFLVDALDIESIENGLTQLIADEKLRSKLAGNAKSNAARFNWDKSARQLLAVFEKAIALRKIGFV